MDLLCDDLRRNLADPKVIIPDHSFVLAFDFAETDFQPILFRQKKPLVAGPPAPPSKRSPRPAWTTLDNAESPTQNTP